jgi:RNA polymerase sigma-70 factor (ECF subfamily)
VREQNNAVEQRGWERCTSARSRDRHLHLALVEGDEDAFHWLVRRDRPAMIRTASRELGCTDLAEEVVQDTFEAVLRDIDQFRGESSLRSWIYRILLNRARRVGQREARQTPLAYVEEVASDLQSQLVSRQELAAVVAQLDRLPERQRQIVQLRAVEGLESEEVSEQLQISAGNQRVLLHRGRATLRQALDELEGAPAPNQKEHARWN